MTPAELHTFIDETLTSDRFVLHANALPGIGIGRMFRHWFDDTRRIALHDAAKVAPGVVCGRLADPFLGREHLLATLTFDIADGEPALRMMCEEFLYDWKPSDGIPELQNTIIAELRYHNCRVTLDSANRDPVPGDFQEAWGYLPDPPVSDSEQIQRGLSFAGTLLVQDLPPALALLFAGAGADGLPIAGSIELREGVPKLWLRPAGGPQANFAALGRELPLALEQAALPRPPCRALSVRRPCTRV